MWSKQMFETFGWMLLAKRDKRALKLEAYKESIQHLINALEERLKSTKCHDKKHDLGVLLKNAKTLQKKSNDIL